LEGRCPDSAHAEKIFRSNLNGLPQKTCGKPRRKPAGLAAIFKLMPMKRRSLPIWLQRDVPSFLGVMISFWPLMILVIRNRFAAMRGRKISKSVFDQLPIFLAHAGSRLDFALWREAYPRLCWNLRAISFEIFPTPES